MEAGSTCQSGANRLRSRAGTFWLEGRGGRGSRRPMLWTHLLIASAVVARNLRAPLARHRDVLTTQGTARGYFAPRPPHYAYLGIPYARSPTHARFKPPKPPRSWDGTFEATHRVKCPQPDGTGSEDCLVINVFVPESAKALPVLVHVHDGGFQRGWGSPKPPVRLLRLGFVVVTFNYRLGALGFLCLRTAGVPGNAGLKDQVAALYWVHRNIGRFGGDPHDVTLYGTGAGGVSVELLLLSELTSDLFHKAIIESGAVLSPSSMSSEPYALGLADAIAMGFKGGGPEDLELFYTTISTSDIINLSRVVHLPCVENNELSNSLLDVAPLQILEHGIYQHVPLLISYTTPEEVAIVRENRDKFNTAPINFEQLLPTNLNFETEDMRRNIAHLVKDFYFDQHELSESIVQNYIDYVNDIFMEYPIVKSSVLHAGRSPWPVYLMKYTYKTRSLAGPYDASDMKDINIFDVIFSSQGFSASDEEIEKRLLSLWSNFIKLGDPTPLTTSLAPVVWQPIAAQNIEGKVDIGRVSYLQFDRAMSNVKPEGQQLLFWDYIYDKFYKVQ